MALSGNAGGYDIAIREFFAKFKNYNFSLPNPSRSAFCAARKKLNWKAFSLLLSAINEQFADSGAPQTWKNHRVFAVDGVRFTLPNCADTNKEAFYLTTRHRESDVYPVSLALATHDVFNGTFNTIEADSCNASEREMASNCLPFLPTNSVLLLDRGFFGFPLMHDILRNGHHFVVRVPAGENDFLWAKPVREFLESGKDSDIVQFDGETLEGYTDETIRVRLLILRKGPEKKPILLATSLIDPFVYSTEQVLRLYKRRWKIEESFNRLKNLHGVELFHARSGNGILQEVFAHIIVYSLTVICTKLAQNRVKQARKANSLRRYPNYKAALGVLCENLHWIIYGDGDGGKLDTILQSIASITCQRQHNRSYPRVSKQPIKKWQDNRVANRQNFYAYKDLQRSVS